MKASSDSKRPADAAGNSALRVRTARKDEHRWFDTLLDQQHPLGAGPPVGDYLRQVVEEAGQVVALLVWGPACYALKDRDLWIGWSAIQRVERLKLVVQNRRFLLLNVNPDISSELGEADLRGKMEKGWGGSPQNADYFQAWAQSPLPPWLASVPGTALPKVQPLPKARNTCAKIF